jgi:hypothetical protein
MSEWRAAINRKALARLDKALPAIFPQGVLIHALQRRFMPPMPRLAVDSYWRAHPVRADRLARALACRQRRAGRVALAACFGGRGAASPAGFPRSRSAGRTGASACAASRPDAGRPDLADPAGALSRARPRARAGVLLRVRPAGLPLRLACGFVGPRRQHERRLACCLRGRLGFMDGAERSCRRAQTAATTALRRDRRTAVADRRGRSSHTAVPGLARASRPRLAAAAAFWGVPNLQVINRRVHVAKCAAEACQRRASPPDGALAQENAPSCPRDKQGGARPNHAARLQSEEKPQRLQHIGVRSLSRGAGRIRTAARIRIPRPVYALRGAIQKSIARALLTFR